MTRGNQREKDRARAAARKAKGKKEGHSAPKIGGTNSDAERLQAKIAAKQKAKQDGTLKDKTKDKGSKYQGGKTKEKAAINPHTGKRDPKWSAKQQK